LIKVKDVKDYFKHQEKVREYFIIRLREFMVNCPDRDKRCNVYVNPLVFNVIVGKDFRSNLNHDPVYAYSYHIKELGIGILSYHDVELEEFQWIKKGTLGVRSSWKWFNDS